jgi:hypothetical protein
MRIRDRSNRFRSSRRKGSSPQCLESVLKCLKAEVGIPHVPVEPFAVLLDFHVLEEVNEHFPFELVVVLFNVSQEATSFGNKMNRKRSRLPGVEISSRNRRDARRVRIGALVEALAGVMDNDSILGRLEDFFQLPLGAPPFAV